jgi:hypothetical protein
MFYANPLHPVRAVILGRFAAVLVHLALFCPCSGCREPVADAAASAPTAATRAALCERIDRALTHVRDRRRLDTTVHGAWQVVHGILAFGRDFQIQHGADVVPALDYLLDGGSLTGWRLRPGEHGLFAVVEEGSTTGQGHPDQWLGYLSQCGLGGIPLETPIRVAGRWYTVSDLLDQAQSDLREGQEATWTLMALATYLPPDAAWTAADGARWTTERVVAMEAAADLSTSACGGAHRLFGLVTAINARRAASGEDGLTGGWASAAEVIEDAIDRARRFQQPDGSFSIHSFDRPGTSADVMARLSATGHLFEVVVAALDDERLREPWVERAAERLVSLLEQTADVDVECGGLYHAAHGLLLYRQRNCPAGRPGPPAPLAE